LRQSISEFFEDLTRARYPKNSVSLLPAIAINFAGVIQHASRRDLSEFIELSRFLPQNGSAAENIFRQFLWAKLYHVAE